MKRALILIVEDDPVIRELTKRQLGALGLECMAVATGEEAVEREDEDIALIFMDLGLPGIDGAQATLLIREKALKQKRKRVPIVALTANSDKQKCFQSGMDDYLQKPALLNDIRGVIQKWLPSGGLS